MKKKILLLLALLAVSASAIQAQGRRALRINEVMVQNDSSVVDDYGRHSAWIELFNSSFAPLEIANVYITNNKAVLDIEDEQERKSLMYSVPLHDVNTRIPKQQHVLFWADNQPTDGTFHTNFTLTAGQPNWVAVFDADGITLIDSVTVPAALLPNTTYARAVDGKDNADALLTWVVRDGLTDSTYITPSGMNVITDSNNKVDYFKTNDKRGFALTVMAMGIVFSALLLLCLCFYAISKIGASKSRERKAKSHGASISDMPKAERPAHDSGEEIAAIVMALHEHLNTHDTENTILTINKVKRAYSPWSSKIYSIRQLPQR